MTEPTPPRWQEMPELRWTPGCVKLPRMPLPKVTLMKSAAKPLSDRAKVVIWAAVVGLVALVSVLTTTGCTSTVIPQPVPAAVASFDNNEQNSGILASTPSGFVVTDNFRQRYNALVATYGADLPTPATVDSGIAPIGDGKWLITKARMVDFLQMNAWRRAGLAPMKR
jgi:hypothetical protein